MPYELKLPDLGEGLSEAELRQWLVKTGDKVAEHQPVLEVETDKVNVEIEAPDEGLLREIKAQAGDTVKFSAVVAIIEKD